MTALTIQCAWSNRRGMSRFAASVDAAENPGIMSHGDSMHPVSGSNRMARSARSLWLRVAIATLCLPVHACDLGTGGAVELSWSLRPASSDGHDKFIHCEGPPVPETGIPRWQVKQIRLHWQVGSTACSHAWSCDDNHGATRFEVPTGMANLWVTPECGDDPATPPCTDDHPAAPDTYIAPAIVQREVIRGEAVTLGAIELVVAVASCPDPPSCICTTSAQFATDHTSP
jgi:hypothetical protein